MSGMLARRPSTVCLWCVFVGAALLGGGVLYRSHRRGALESQPVVAQEPQGNTLLGTSFGGAAASGPTVSPEIFQINTDGSGRRSLLPKTTVATTSKPRSFDPALSPDGRQVAFVG